MHGKDSTFFKNNLSRKRTVLRLTFVSSAIGIKDLEGKLRKMFDELNAGMLLWLSGCAEKL